jgi:hypothetical protein
MKEIDMFINRSQQAYNNFRQRNMTATEKETLTSPL